MQLRQWKTSVWTLMLTGLLSLGLLSPATVLAGQDKEDVCHLEGNGTYILINIAEPAYPTHEAHGDVKVGEPVPGSDGFVFDDYCNIAKAVVECPCVDAYNDFFNTYVDYDYYCWDHTRDDDTRFVGIAKDRYIWIGPGSRYAIADSSALYCATAFPDHFGIPQNGTEEQIQKCFDILFNEIDDVPLGACITDEDPLNEY
jgi:hypothetical protein